MGPNDKIRTSFSLDPLIDELFFSLCYLEKMNGNEYYKDLET